MRTDGYSKNTVRLVRSVGSMLYWISRIWMLADRGRLHDDPVLFAVKDPTSYAVGAIAAIVLVLARL